MRAAPPRRIVVVAAPGVKLLDVAGPMEVFARAGLPLGESANAPGAFYRLELATRRAGPLATSIGVPLLAARSLAETRGAIDTILVAGVRPGDFGAEETAIVRWLRRAAPRARRVGSICTGAFCLAAAGLLDGRRATTHWAYAERLAELHPRVRVEADPIFVRDGRVATSAGISAGMDLALALVEEDHGHEVAHRIARELVLFLRRPGGQSQFSELLEMQRAERAPIRAVQAYVTEHADDDLSVETLAGVAAMSVRNFTRVFTREVGLSPARFVERVRLEAARLRLLDGGAGVEEIAASAGWSSAERMRQAFVRVYGTSPSAYRARFAAGAARARHGGTAA